MTVSAVTLSTVCTQSKEKNVFVFDDLSGVIPPLATPLTDDHKIDVPNLRRLVNYVIDGGSSGVFVMGSTGEFPFFSREVRRSIIETVVDETNGRVPVLAGISDAGTELAIMNTKDAEEVGADAIVCTLPYYFATPQESAILEHFRSVAQSTKLPMAMYNIPSTVKTFIKVNVVVKLAEEGTAKSIKDSSTDFIHFQDLTYALRHMPKFRIFQGSEFQIGASVLMGAHGGVLGVANLAPRLCVQLYEAAARGDAAQTRELQRQVTALSQLFWTGESVVGSLKAALSIVGLCSPITSIPMPSASEGSIMKIRQIMVDCGLLDS